MPRGRSKGSSNLYKYKYVVKMENKKRYYKTINQIRVENPQISRDKLNKMLNYPELVQNTGDVEVKRLTTPLPVFEKVIDEETGKINYKLILYGDE